MSYASKLVVNNIQVEVSRLGDKVASLETEKEDLEKQLAGKIAALAEQERVGSLQAARVRVLESQRSTNDERALLVFLSGRIENQVLRTGYDNYGNGAMRPLRDYVFEELRTPPMYQVTTRGDDRPYHVEHIRRRFRYLRQVGKLHIYEEV